MCVCAVTLFRGGGGGRARGAIKPNALWNYPSFQLILGIIQAFSWFIFVHWVIPLCCWGFIPPPSPFPTSKTFFRYILSTWIHKESWMALLLRARIQYSHFRLKTRSLNPTKLHHIITYTTRTVHARAKPKEWTARQKKPSVADRPFFFVRVSQASRKAVTSPCNPGDAGPSRHSAGVINTVVWSQHIPRSRVEIWHFCQSERPAELDREGGGVKQTVERPMWPLLSERTRLHGSRYYWINVTVIFPSGPLAPDKSGFTMYE